MEALQRNVEAKRSGYHAEKSSALPQVFSMNTYWYIYTRTKNTELGKLLGDSYMNKNYKVVAEESAYMYQKIVWVPLVRVLEKDTDLELESKEAMVGLVREKMEVFYKGLDDVSKKHKGCYSIPDGDLKEPIRLATVRLVVPAYSGFVEAFSILLPEKGSYLSAEKVEEPLCHIFEGGDVKILKIRGSRDRTGQGAWRWRVEEVRSFDGQGRVLLKCES